LAASRDVIHRPDPRELDDLLHRLIQPGAAAEFVALAACLVGAWAVVRLVRGRKHPVASVWFGDRIFDGVLFPIVALAFALVARVALETMLEPAVFRLAIPILVSLLIIRLSVRVLRATFPTTSWVRTVEHSISWLAWIAVVLWITGILPLMADGMADISWKVGAGQVSLLNMVEGAVTAGLVLVVALWVSGVIERKLLSHAGTDLSMRKMAANVVRTLLLFVGLLLALSAVGIDLTALSVVGGALAVGLGFGLQKIAANYVSGFVILAERSLRIGDMVKVDTFEGRITDIRTRYTIIRSLGGRESIVPNETLITQRVENATLADPRVLISTAVQVAYGTDVRRLESLLLEAVRTVPRVIDDPAPGVQLTDFAADGMNLGVQFWIRDPENGQGNVKSAVNLAVLDVLNREQVEIPYPQRVVHARVSRERDPQRELSGPVPSAGAGAAPEGAARNEPEGTT
jgi:small-conductance mechanosensitive channel